MQDLCEVLARHSIDHAVMDLADDGEAAPFHAFDDPRFPEWFRLVEGLRHDARGQSLQLFVASRARQAGVADVIIEIELIVINPDRVSDDGSPREFLSITRNQM